MTGAVLPAVLAGAAVALLVVGRPRLRVEPVRAEAVGSHDRGVLARLRPVLVGLSFVAGWTFVGGAFGVPAGVAAAAVTWRVLGNTESPSARRRRAELERDLPAAVHLLGACLEAGSPVTGALQSVAAALPGAVADELSIVRGRLALGADPVVVWRELAGVDEVRPLGRAMVRAHESGASVRDAVRHLAVDLAAQSRARTDVLARTVEVRAAAPLGLCFLPAFILLGVVPMVVGVFSSMRLFG